MERLEVLNPVAKKFAEQKHRSAPRLSDLNGKVIGIYWNLKAGGDVALKRAVENLSNRFRRLKFRHYSGSMGGRTVLTAKGAVAVAPKKRSAIMRLFDFRPGRRPGQR